MALLLPQMARLPPRLYLAPGRPQAPVRLLPQMHPAPQAAMQRPPEVAAAAGTDLPEDVLDLGKGFPPSKPQSAYAPKCCVSPTGAPTCKPSQPTPGAPERASVGTLIASKSVVLRVCSMARLRELPADHRGDEDLHGKGTFRRMYLERHPACRGPCRELWRRGQPRSWSPTPALDGLLVEAHALCIQQSTQSRTGERSQGRTGGPQKGAAEGEIILKYLDESGFSLCLAPTHLPGRRRAR